MLVFSLNEYGDLNFLSHNNSVHVILLNLKRKLKNYRKEKVMSEGVRKNVSRMQIMTTKTTTRRTLYVHVVLNSVLFHKFYMISFHMLETFYSLSFLPSFTF